MNMMNNCQLAFGKVNPLIHFGLWNGTKSSPRLRFFTPQGVEAELRCAAREFFQTGEVEVDLDKRTVHLPGIIKWFVLKLSLFPFFVLIILLVLCHWIILNAGFFNFQVYISKRILVR